MKLNYTELAEAYKPEKIKTLLIGEAPPPNGKAYFYKIPDKCSVLKDIEKDTKLPSTIFNHYFSQRPSNPTEYSLFLERLKDEGIFLIDMYEKPETFRGNKENWGLLFTDHNLESLRNRITSLIDEKTKVIFLHPRKYKADQRKKLKAMFPSACYVRWKDFRINPAAFPINIDDK